MTSGRGNTPERSGPSTEGEKKELGHQHYNLHNMAIDRIEEDKPKYMQRKINLHSEKKRKKRKGLSLQEPETNNGDQPNLQNLPNLPTGPSQDWNEGRKSKKPPPRPNRIPKGDWV